MNIRENLHALARGNYYLRINGHTHDRLSLIKRKRILEKQVNIMRKMMEEDEMIYTYYQNYLFSLLNQINDIQLELEILCG